MAKVQKTTATEKKIEETMAELEENKIFQTVAKQEANGSGLNLCVRIKLSKKEGNIKALASVNINECLAITNIKVMDSEKGIFISMPSYKTQSGEYKKICFPVTKEFREQLHNAILEQYILEQATAEKQETEKQEEECVQAMSM